MALNHRQIPDSPAVFFIAAFIVSLALYWPTLNCFFICDELPLISESAPQLGRTWLDWFTPIPNGFIRLPHRILGGLTLTIFGLEPFGFHITALLIHSIAAMMTGIAAKRLFSSTPAAWLATILMASHIGGYGSGIMLSNVSDSVLAIWVLSAWLAWDRWISEGKPRWLLLTYAMCALAFLTKETAVVVPGFLFLWALVKGANNRKTWVAFAGVCVMTLCYCAAVYLMQKNNPASYASAGTISLSPKHFIRQLLDHYASLFIPFLHVVNWPFIHVELPDTIFWGIRAATAIGLAYAAIFFIARPKGRIFLFLLMVAALPLMPPSVLNNPPQVRYLYISLPFICLLVVGLLMRLKDRRIKIPFIVAVSLLWCMFVLGLYASPTLIDYRHTCGKVEIFVKDLEKVSPTWVPGSMVAIFNHPHPGDPAYQWPNGQMIFNIFMPKADAHLALDKITPETRYAYRFDGKSLVEIPIEK